MKILLTILFFIVANVTCIAQDFLSLVVYVTDSETGAPVSNAYISIKESGWIAKPTGRDGKALFDNSVPVGEIHYSVIKEGFLAVESIFNITTEKKSNTLNVKLKKAPLPNEDKILITGKVLDKEDGNLEGATVEVRLAEIVQTTKSDVSGNYAVEVSISKSKFQTNMLRMEVSLNGSCKKNETVDLTRANVIYKDFRLECLPAGKKEKDQVRNNTSGGSEAGNQKESLDGVEVVLVECKVFDNKLICNLTYENVGASPSVDVLFGREKNIVIDGNGNTYKSIKHVIGNIEGMKYGYSRFNLIKGFKVNANITFYITDINIDKVASLVTASKHTFYNITITK